MGLLYKSFENIVEKGEIARHEQFLLFHSVFYPFQNLLPSSLNLKLSSAGFQFGRVLNLSLGKELTLYTQSWLLTTLGKKPFEKIVGKGENAGNQYFLLFTQCFLPNQ